MDRALRLIELQVVLVELIASGEFIVDSIHGFFLFMVTVEQLKYHILLVARSNAHQVVDALPVVSLFREQVLSD